MLAHTVMLRCSVALLVGLSVAGCGGSSSDPIAFEDVTTQINGEYAAATYVLRTQADLEAAWKASTLPTLDTPSTPSFDFSLRMIVGVSLGVGLRCYIPQITRVEQSGNNVTVYWRSSGPDGPTTLACLHQWPLNNFVAVPQLSGQVTFVRIET